MIHNSKLNFELEIRDASSCNGTFQYINNITMVHKQHYNGT